MQKTTSDISSGCLVCKVLIINSCYYYDDDDDDYYYHPLIIHI